MSRPYNSSLGYCCHPWWKLITMQNLRVDYIILPLVYFFFWKSNKDGNILSHTLQIGARFRTIYLSAKKIKTFVFILTFCCSMWFLLLCQQFYLLFLFVYWFLHLGRRSKIYWLIEATSHLILDKSMWLCLVQERLVDKYWQWKWITWSVHTVESPRCQLIAGLRWYKIRSPPPSLSVLLIFFHPLSNSPHPPNFRTQPLH